MKVSELITALSLEPISLPQPDREIDGCYIGDLLSWVMSKAREDNAWITIMSNINIVAVASLTDVSCVILAEGVMPEQDVIDVAKSKGVNLLVAPNQSAYAIATAIAGVL